MKIEKLYAIIAIEIWAGVFLSIDIVMRAEERRFYENKKKHEAENPDCHSFSGNYHCSGHSGRGGFFLLSEL